MIFEFDSNRGLFVARSTGRKSGLAVAFNRRKLAFAVSAKYLSNETKIYIFIARIPRVVYIIFWGIFPKILFFLLLVDIYRHPLLKSFFILRLQMLFNLIVIK